MRSRRFVYERPMTLRSAISGTTNIHANRTPMATTAINAAWPARVPNWAPSMSPKIRVTCRPIKEQQRVEQELRRLPERQRPQPRARLGEPLERVPT